VQDTTIVAADTRTSFGLNRDARAVGADG